MKTYKLKIIYGYVLIVNPTANCQTSNGVETSKAVRSDQWTLLKSTYQKTAEESGHTINLT